MAHGVVLDDQSVPGSIGQTNPMPVRIKDGVTGDDVALVKPPTTPTFYNVVMTNADQEYSQALPDNTKRVDIKLRSMNAKLKISFTSGESGAKYLTISYGALYSLQGVNLSSKTLYFQSPSVSQVAEIIAWT